MKLVKALLILISIFSLLLACNKDKIQIQMQNSCDFVQNEDNLDGLLDEEEEALVVECIEDRLNSIEDIEDNLIGEWELIGYSDHRNPSYSQPCAYIVITQNTLTFEFENAEKDTIASYSWAVQEGIWPGGLVLEFFIIQLSTSDRVEGLEMTHFCTNYMYGNHTPSSRGDFYLYRKVR
jgi:hypothetical protein